ncbi:MAG TPA: glycosyltransferase [Chitinophagaceae bacterium]
MQKRVVIIGPAYPLRGGLATFDQRLAQEFGAEGTSCEIVSFSLQYPSLLFPGKTQYSTDEAPKDITIRSLINSVNPANWLLVGNMLRDERPDIVVVRFWIPFMGPALGTILRRIKKNGHTKVICIADNVIPHERRPGDKAFTRYFLKACDGFITMSDKVLKDLRLFEQSKPAVLVQHPLYDTFGERMDQGAAREKLGLGKEGKLVLFFGFIRHYKGLDLLLQAMNDTRIRQEDIKLLVAGEFYEDEKLYHQLIAQYNLADRVILRSNFIPDSEVRYYLCAADVVVQPYRNATQSGVTPLAYHFEKPMIVTNVGGLPSLVPHERAGLVCEPEPSSIADALLRFYQLGEQYFIPHLRTEKQKYAWSNLTGAVYKLAEEIG